MATQPFPKVILVTGANQGLGYAIIEVLGLRFPDSTCILCSRVLSSGQEAAQSLAKSGLKANIEVLQLDVTNDEHIQACVEHVEEKYEKLDILINNAGISHPIPGPYPTTYTSLPEQRSHWNSVLNVNLASVAVLTSAFLPLLHSSKFPKVINVTSGLSSMSRMLKMKIFRAAVYGSSKVGLNGLTVHMQIAENDCEGKEGIQPIDFYTVEPGILKTRFTGYRDGCKDPKEGVEVISSLVGDDEGKYPGGTYWQSEGGEMREVAW